MRAIVLKSHGDPDVLTLTDVPDPEPGPEEVVVEVTATALNRADVLQRMGFYPEPGPPREHEIPGMELSGTVVARGARVTMWREGDAVMGIVTGGAYAERVAVHERMLLPVPQSVPVADAAAIPEVWITAFDALVVQGGLTSGRTALVHAGASGVGTAAIQIAKAIGAGVVVTASTAKVAACRELGADAVTTTVAPRAFAIWIAAVPTPDAPACTSAAPPGARPPCTISASNAVIHTSGNEPASVTTTVEGTAASWRSCTAMRCA